MSHIEEVKEVSEDRDRKKHLFELELAKCRKDCEACADGFISTHEKATNEIRKQERERIKKQLAVVEIPKGKAAGYNVDGKQYVALAMAEEDWQALKGEDVAEGDMNEQNKNRVGKES